jgi:hypothetical protein
VFSGLVPETPVRITVHNLREICTRKGGISGEIPEIFFPGKKYLDKKILT